MNYSSPWNVVYCSLKQNTMIGNCSKCGNVVERKDQRYCNKCHATYMRERRKKHMDLTDNQRIKANCRSYANVYKRRGLLIMQPCIVCGVLPTQMHHNNYASPLAVTWLCGEHHKLRHTKERESNVKSSNR